LLKTKTRGRIRVGLLPLNFLMGEGGNRRGKEWKKENES